MTKKLLPLLLLGFLLSCSSTKDTTSYDLTDYDERNIEMSSDLEDDAEIAEFIAPYIRELGKEMNRVLTIAEGSFERDQPEGSLGNLIADLSRSRASSELRKNVDIVIMNNGGLRVPLPSGEITVGLVFELMPFDNIIAVLTLTGEQVLQAADELAACGGEPISGMRLRIDGNKATDVLVGSSEVDPDKEYLLATNNWMADGGGCIPTLWNPVERNDLPLLIRDAIIDHFNSRETITPKIDNRLRG